MGKNTRNSRTTRRGKTKRSGLTTSTRSFANRKRPPNRQFFVRTPTGTRTLPFSNKLKVKDLRAALGVDRGDFVLSFGGVPLRDHDRDGRELTLSDYGIHSQSNLEMWGRLRGGHNPNREGRLHPDLVRVRNNPRTNRPEFVFTRSYHRRLQAAQHNFPQSSGILPQHLAAYSEFAVLNDTVIMMRNVNPRAGELLRRPDVIGKPMTMKGKSSNGGKGTNTFDPTAGFIPRNQNFSKIPLSNPAKITRFQGLVETALQGQKASSSQLTTEGPNGETREWFFIDRGNNQFDFVFRYQGQPDQGYFSLNKDAQGQSAPGSVESPADVTGLNLQALEVMGDPKTGKLYTADYDPLVYAVNAEGQQNLSFKPIPEDAYQQLGADLGLHAVMENSLENLASTNHPLLQPLQTQLTNAHRLMGELNALGEDDQQGRSQKATQVTPVLRDIYQGLTALRRDLGAEEEGLNFALQEFQTLIEDTDLVTPRVSQVRSAITLEEDVINAHFNKETDRATSHAPETTNKGAFREELYDDLRTGVVVFLPNGELKMIKNAQDPAAAERELVLLINQLRNDGYAIVPNPRWGWEMGVEGNFHIPPDEHRIDFALLNDAIGGLPDNNRKTELKAELDKIFEVETARYLNHHAIAPAIKPDELEVPFDFQKRGQAMELMRELVFQHPKVPAGQERDAKDLFLLRDADPAIILELLQTTDIPDAHSLFNLVESEFNQNARLVLKMYRNGNNTAQVRALLGQNSDAFFHT